MTEYFDLLKLLAGLGLFLFGMRQLELALEQIAGKTFKRILKESTDKPIRSVFSGIITTTIVQSSSLVSLIVLAFVGAGIIPLVNAIGVVLGSNLGTTFTGWIVITLGFKLDFNTVVYPLLALGGLSFGLFKGRWKSFSLLVIGLALLLMGLDFMKESVNTLTAVMDISELKNYPLIVYLLIGAIFTAIIQSSSATMMLTLSALHAGIIPLPIAATFVIGADLGTTSTVLLGSLQGVVGKRQLAMADVLFNVVIDAFAFLFLIPLLSIIEKIHITNPLYALVAFHSLFNLLGLLIFIPFVKQYATILQRWITEKSTHIDLYIHKVPHRVTDAALEALLLETKHLLYLVLCLNVRFLKLENQQQNIQSSAFIKSDEVLTQTKLDHYITLKKLEGEIINYALKIQLKNYKEKRFLNKETQFISQRIDKLMKAIRYGVYSAKSLKDINENLDYFHLTDNEELSEYFEILKRSTEDIYIPAIYYLNRSEDQKLFKEELNNLNNKSEIFHHNFADKIYHKMNRDELSFLDLSTLLNVNSELRTSEKALIEALELL